MCRTQSATAVSRLRSILAVGGEPPMAIDAAQADPAPCWGRETDRRNKDRPPLEGTKSLLVAVH